MNTQERLDLVEHRINRAQETLKEVDVLIKNKFWSTSINRLYYAVIALLVKNEIKAQTHAGVRQMFGLYFIKAKLIDKSLGQFYSDIFDKRQTGDYDDFVTFTESEVKSLLQLAKQLIHEIERLLKND